MARDLFEEAGLAPAQAREGRDLFQEFGVADESGKINPHWRETVPDASVGSVAQDILSGALQIGPTALKGIGDIGQLASGGRIGKGLSDSMEEGNRAIRDTFGSNRAAAQARNFQRDMADDEVGVLDTLTRNKGALADQLLPTIGSMFLPVGVAGAAGKVATAGRAAQGMDKAAIAARVAKVQEAAGIGTIAAQNAGDTFSEMLDKGVPLEDAYKAAGITVPFSVVAGVLTKGGAEADIAGNLFNKAAVKHGAGSVLKAGAREGAQEIGEQAGQDLGSAVATGETPSLTAEGKSLAVAGALGGLMGSGVHGAGEAGRAMSGAQEEAGQTPAPQRDVDIDVTYPDARGNPVTEFVPGGVATGDTEQASQALREPVGLTALDRVGEIDTELAKLQARAAELNAGDYGPMFDTERADLAGQQQALIQERDGIAATWPKAQQGAQTSFSTESGDRLDASYALMDAGDLVTSHDEGLRENPLYPKELQPRDRSRSASELQVSGIVQKLDPARLGVSADAATGAPIVGADGLVESGNARTIAMKRVYQANGQKAADYRKFLKDNAAQFGLTPEQVDAVNKPVLVRVRQTPVNRAEFARQANASTVQRMSPSEQALSDARRINTLQGLEPNEDGNFSSSRDFIRQFMAMLPITEQSDMIESDGQLSTAGYRRIQNAVLARAYGDSPTLRRMTESMDDNLRNISNALTRVAPTIAAARERMDAGTLNQADIAPDLVQAVEGLSALKDKGWKVSDELGQQDLTGPKYSPEAAELLQFLDANIRSPRRIAEFVQRYYEALEQAGDPTQPSMFGDEPAPSRSELLNRAKGEPSGGIDQNAQRRDAGEGAPAGAQDGRQPEVAPGRRGGAQGDEVAGGQAGARQQAVAAVQSASRSSQGAGRSEWVNFPKDSGTIGIPRAEMPQVKGDHRGALLQFLQGKGITYEKVQLQPKDLKPTQAEFSKEKAARWSKVRDGVERSVLVSSDGHVLDGHHQWVAALAANEPVDAIRFDAPIRELLAATFQFPSVQRSEGAEDARAKNRQAFKDALADLADLATKHQRVAMVPENMPGLMPTLIKLMEAGIKEVGYSLKDLTDYVKDRLKADPRTKKFWNKIGNDLYRKAAQQAMERSARAHVDDLFAQAEGGKQAMIDGRPYDLKRDNYKVPDTAGFIPAATLKRIKEMVSSLRKAAVPVSIGEDDRARAESVLAPILEHAQEAKAEFDQKVIDITKRTKSLGQMLTTVKSMESATRKLVNEVAFDTDKMYDTLRSTVVVNSYDDAQAVLDAIRDEFEVLPGRVKNMTSAEIDGKAGKFLPSGYGQVLVNVKMPGGVIGEIQINVPEMLAVKLGDGHALYEIERAEKNGTQARADAVALQREIYPLAASAAAERNDSSLDPLEPIDTGKSRIGVKYNKPDSSSSPNTRPSGNLTNSVASPLVPNSQPSGNLSGTFIGTSNGSSVAAGAEKSDGVSVVIAQRAKRIADNAGLPIINSSTLTPERKIERLRQEANRLDVNARKAGEAKTPDIEKAFKRAAVSLRAAADELAPKQNPSFKRKTKSAEVKAQEAKENFARWSDNAPLVTSETADTYEFKTGEKIVVEAYHGSARPDRVGGVFDPKRATSGPMAFFTSNPELASSYANGKADTSLADEDQEYANWFKFKPPGSRSSMPIDRAWHFLTPEQKQNIIARMPDIRMDDDGNVIYEEGGGDLGGYAYEWQRTQTRYDRQGNPLRAAVESWLNSGALFNNELEFMKVLKLAGFPTKEVTADFPTDTFPGVFKTYVSMKKPLVVNDIPADVLASLEQAAKTDRTKPKPGADMWDKRSHTIKEWWARFNDPSSSQYAWTSIPDKVTAIFKEHGYDGIVDWSGKGGSHRSPVYIPFASTQVKGFFNRGTYDGTKKDFNFSRGVGTKADPATMERVQSEVDGIRARWKNAPPIVVIDSLQDAKVPEAVRNYDAQQRSQGATGEPEGFFYKGKVYIVASQVPTAHDVARVMMHESLGHYGLRGVFGDKLDSVLDQIWQVRRKEVIKRARQYGLHGEAITEDSTDAQVWQSMTRDQRRQAAEEVLAFMAQEHPELGFVRRAVAAIRTWLRAHVPGLRVSDDEIIANYLLPARGWVERRAQASPFDEGAMFARSDSTKAAYESRIDALFGGGKATSGTRLLDRSDVMGLLGHPDVPLMLNERHLLDGLTNHPEMTASAWKKVPGWLENPAAVYTDPRHPGRYTVIAPERIAGYPVVLAVEPNPTPAERGKQEPFQLLVTAFANTTGDLPAIGHLAASGRLLYVDTKTAPVAWPRAGEIPRTGGKASGAKRILTEKNLAGWRRANPVGDAPALSRTAPADDASAQSAAPRSAAQRAEDMIRTKVVKMAPLDAVAHAITKYTGVEKLTRKAYETAGRVLDVIVPEKVKAGIVSDYGVAEAVIDQRALLQGRMRVQLRKAGKLIDKLSTLTRAESRVAYEWMNMDGSDPKAYLSMMQGLPEESVQVLHDVQKMIDDLSQEAVRLGQLDPRSYERNKFAYLRRSYAKHVLDMTPGEKTKRARVVSILGEQYKGRGMTQAVRMNQVKDVAPGWWGRKLKGGRADTALVGEKFIRLERRAASGQGTAPLPGMQGKAPGKVLEVAWWPASETMPATYKDWTNEGTWEARDTKAGDIIMWRDFTKEEREAMGEIDEARFAIARTLQAMIHDVETGRYLEWIARNQGLAPGATVPGTVVEASERLRDSFTKDEWVQVPETKIPGTQVLKYGKLAGRFIPGPVWNDLRQVVSGQAKPLGETYAKILTLWKTSKTALSPAVHMNNVMSNFVMADFHDVTAGHVAKALRILLAAHERDGKGALGRTANALARAGIADREAAREVLNRYKDSGGDIGTFATAEIAREQIEPLLQSVEQELMQTNGTSLAAQAGVFAALQHLIQRRPGAALEALKSGKAGQKVAQEAASMIGMYQAEDDVFRLAAWLKAKEDGATDIDAGKSARRSFLDYHINAPWVNAMRHTALPFISFTYRAVPMMLETIGKKPHKLMKLMMVAGAVNALGMMAVGGDDDDEKRVRKLLPEEKAGSIWGMVPKLVRMPWNDKNGSPVYLDVRRFIPIGDFFDLGETHSAIPLLPFAMPGGPLALMSELISNRSQFTGRDIYQETDTPAQQAAKVADHVYKSFAPNIIGLPGTYATTSVVNAIKGKTDVFGREQSAPYAIASSFGIKLAGYSEDVLKNDLKVKTQIQLSEIDRNIGRLKRQLATHAITREEFNDKAAVEVEKKRKLATKFREKVG